MQMTDTQVPELKAVEQSTITTFDLDHFDDDAYHSNCAVFAIEMDQVYGYWRLMLAVDRSESLAESNDIKDLQIQADKFLVSAEGRKHLLTKEGLEYFWFDDSKRYIERYGDPRIS